MTDDVELQMFSKCSAAVRKAIDPLMLEHDGRLVLACVLAEAAYIGAMLRSAKVRDTATLTQLFVDALIVAQTLETKPKVFYTSDGQPLGTEQ